MAVKKQVAAAAGYGEFEQISGVERSRLLYRSWGQDKTGKNHFGYTMPDPIFGIYFDPVAEEGVAEKFVRGEVDGQPKKRIYRKHYRFIRNMTQEQAQELRDKFLTELEEVVLPNARSLQVDETELWELFRYAEFGCGNDTPKEYERINGMFRGWIQDCGRAGVNVQLIEKVKEKWGVTSRGLGPTGQFEPMGFKEARYLIQVNLEHTWDANSKKFGIKVVNCRQNMSIANTEVIDDPEGGMPLNFALLGQMVYPNTTAEDWQ